MVRSVHHKKLKLMCRISVETLTLCVSSLNGGWRRAAPGSVGVGPDPYIRRLSSTALGKDRRGSGKAAAGELRQ